MKKRSVNRSMKEKRKSTARRLQKSKKQEKKERKKASSRSCALPPRAPPSRFLPSFSEKPEKREARCAAANPITPTSTKEAAAEAASPLARPSSSGSAGHANTVTSRPASAGAAARPRSPFFATRAGLASWSRPTWKGESRKEGRGGVSRKERAGIESIDREGVSMSQWKQTKEHRSSRRPFCSSRPPLARALSLSLSRFLPRPPKL